MKKKIIYILTLCLLPTVINGQIKGRIIDKNQQPLSFANVVLLTVGDSTFVEGTISREDGSFLLSPAARLGNYLLEISFIGYETKILPCKLPADLEDITLNVSSTMLTEVEVKGTMPLTRMKNGSLITNVQGSVLSNYGSANDVLAKVPSVLKREEGFEVFGKGTPLIYINNRMVRDNAELEQLHSADIKSIEVINNPGSAYDASVKSVIRIHTVRKQGNGWGLNVRSGYTQSETASWLGQIDANYRHNGLDIFGTFKYDDKYVKGTSKSDITAFADTLWNQKNAYDISMKNRAVQTSLGFNYIFNPNHSIGVKYILGNTLKSKTTANYVSEIFADNKPYDYLLTDRYETKDDDPQHQLNLYYAGKIKKWAINLDVDYYGNSYKQDVLAKENSKEHISRDVNSVNDVENDLYAAKFMVSRPLWNGNLYFGTEYTRTNRCDDYFNPEGYVPTSYTRIKENSITGFAEYSRHIVIGDLVAGLRYEHIDFNYYENNILQNNESRSYGDLFPNLSFDTKLGNVQTQISYTAKIKRPSYRQLSNNVKYINRFTWQTGNPILKPTTLHDITLTGVWKFLMASVSYQLDRDAIINWGEQVKGNSSTTLITYTNKHRLPHLSAMVSATPKIGIWNPQLSVGVDKQWLKLNSEEIDMEFNKPVLMGMFNNTFMLPKGIMLNADLFFQSKGNNLNRYNNNEMIVFDIALAKAFLKKALVIEVRGNDLFYQFNNNTITRLNHSEVWERGKNNTRKFTLSVRYRFNQSRSNYKGKGAGQEMKTRL